MSGMKAPCAQAVWGQPDSPLSEVLATLKDLVKQLVTLYEQ